MNINDILEKHRLWLKGKGGGKANLSNANLSCANLRGADLTDGKIRAERVKLLRKVSREELEV